MNNKELIMNNEKLNVGARPEGIPVRHDTTVPETRSTNKTNATPVGACIARPIRETQKGITLIALIITIIVMLILAGMVLNLTIGERGIFKTARNAGKEYEIAEIKEQINLDILDKQSENMGNISDESLEEILLKYGTLTDEENILDKTLTTTKGNHEIKISEIFNGTTLDDDEPSKSYPLKETMRGANSPNIRGFNAENTYYVTWGTTAPYQINEASTINNAPPSGWSNYNGKEWANIKTTGGGNDCYWVWIPRYAYKVPKKGKNAETIEIAFLKGTGSTIDDVIDETKKTEIETAGGFKTTATTGNWVIHPAFTNEGNGGFGELTGIWVAKFEASSNASNVVENPSYSQLGIDGGSETDTDLKVRVKPNVTSWRKITVNDVFTVCRNLTETGNSLENTSNLNSHMMKNTEWGAVAYLSRSVHGINGEVWNNPYYNNSTNYSPITGLCGTHQNGKKYGTSDKSSTCKYNEVGGGNASTTGNVYGIYDMAGGAHEFVAGVYKGTSSDDLGGNSKRSALWDSSNVKYVDQYTKTNGFRREYYGNTSKYGDAIYETSSSGDDNASSWGPSQAYFPGSDRPVILRGGGAFGGSIAGAFSYTACEGGDELSQGFRPVVLNFRK